MPLPFGPVMTTNSPGLIFRLRLFKIVERFRAGPTENDRFLTCNIKIVYTPKREVAKKHILTKRLLYVILTISVSF